MLNISIVEQYCSVAFQVWAVEKNPNAVVTLQAMHANLGWGDQVTIVAKDMRKVRCDE